MAHDFRCPERRQSFLLPPDMRDWLPEDDIVHLICAVSRHHFNFRNAISTAYSRTWMRSLVSS
jgi:hypothetical protein